MNPLRRFFALGMQDADRRVAAMLRHDPLEAADQYLKESAIVRSVDRVTLLWRAWWNDSETRRVVASVIDAFARSSRSERYREAGAVIVTAVVVHVMLTILHGPRPGWFWMVIPGMAAIFALLLLAAAREPRTH